MNKFIFPFILLLNISSININPLEITDKTKHSNKFIIVKDDLYNLQIAIETDNNNQPALIFSIELKKGSYFVSPNEKREFTGKFYYDLGGYDNIDFKDTVIETPISIKEVASDNNESINWVRKNTKYKQLLNLKTNSDFKVFGRVKFTIEPHCTLEETPFVIIYKSGKFSVEQVKC